MMLRALVLSFLLLPSWALSRFEFEKPQMGVPFRVVLYADDKAIAESAAEAAFARVSQLNAIMSDYESDSELNRLGRSSGSGKAVKLSGELWTVLRAGEKFSRASDGAFDVTVSPYVQLWRRARRNKEMPSEESLQRARGRVGYSNMILRNGSAELKAPDMRLDLGAIAKGYATDEATRVLRRFGITRSLVAASGDMTLGDAPPGEKGWKVQLFNAAETNRTPFLVVKNCGVATSGDLFQFVEINGTRYSHIVDPRTGVGLTDRSLVTVVAKDGMTADALSTSISVLGPEKGLKLARKFGAQARETRISENGEKIDSATRGFWKKVTWIK